MLVDVSGDGHLDAVVADNATLMVSVLLGNGDGTFRPKVDLPAGANPRSVAVTDVSGDGKADIVVANQTPNTVSVLLGNGDGTFRPRVDDSSGPSPLDGGGRRQR